MNESTNAAAKPALTVETLLARLDKAEEDIATLRRELRHETEVRDREIAGQAQTIIDLYDKVKGMAAG